MDSLRVSELAKELGKTSKEIIEKFAEIDIIAQDKDELTFVEVKYRKNTDNGDPLEAVTAYKQKRIYNAAKFFLKDKGYDIDNTFIRFDVIGVLDNEIKHIKNAF